MKKGISCFLFLLIIIIFIPFSAKALDTQNPTSVQEINTDTKEMNNLYNYILKMKSDNEIISKIEIKQSIESLMKNGTINIDKNSIIRIISKYVLKDVVEAVKFMAVILAICIVCALLTNLENTLESKEIVNISKFVCYLIIIALVAKNFYSCVSLATKTINQIAGFMSCLMPLIVLLMTASGGITEVAVLDPVIIGAINISLLIYIKLIIPLILVYFVLQFVKNISPDYKIDKLGNLFKQLALWIQGITMTVFIGIITIKDVVSGSVDGVTAKTAKYAVDNFIPVVGGCLSDALSTVAGYSFLLKSAVSGIGLVIIVLIILFPIITLAVIAFLYKFTGGIIEPVCGSKLADIMDEIGNSVILLSTCVLSISVMFFITICIFASAGKMVL